MLEELIVKDLRFSFQQDSVLINCPYFRFQAGSIYALVGANGSGKTTFLRLLLGLLKPDRGSIDGIAGERIGFVPDYNGLYDSLTILENIKFRLSLYDLKYKAEKDNVHDMLARYQLEKEANKLVRDISLGMKKKTALICALATNPTLLILDEPTGGLDAAAQKELAYMLEEFISPSKTVILTSHDADFIHAMPFCSTVSFPMEA